MRNYTYFTGFDPVRSKLLLDDTMLQLARLDAWIAIIVLNLAVQETQGNYGQKWNLDLFGKIIQVATGQLAEALCRLIEYLEHQDLCIHHDHKA